MAQARTLGNVCFPTPIAIPVLAIGTTCPKADRRLSGGTADGRLTPTCRHSSFTPDPIEECVGHARTNMLIRRTSLLLVATGAAAVALPAVTVQLLGRGPPPLYITLGSDDRYLWAPPPPGTFREVQSERGVEIATGIMISCRVRSFYVETGTPETPNVFRANTRELNADQTQHAASFAAAVARPSRHHHPPLFQHVAPAISRLALVRDGMRQRRLR
jgi:hypothetical protein